MNFNFPSSSIKLICGRQNFNFHHMFNLSSIRFSLYGIRHSLCSMLVFGVPCVRTIRFLVTCAQTSGFLNDWRRPLNILDCNSSSILSKDPSWKKDKSYHRLSVLENAFEIHMRHNFGLGRSRSLRCLCYTILEAIKAFGFACFGRLGQWRIYEGSFWSTKWCRFC